MRILAKPAFECRSNNPYNWLLYSNMQDLGVCVEESSALRLLWGNYAIWHLHWPESPLNKKNVGEAFVKMRLLLFQMDWARSRGTKVVWTVHNLAAHEQLHLILEAWFWKAFIQRLDGYISLSEAGLKAVQERFPKLTNLPSFVTPHGHYRGEYPDYISSQEARVALGIPPTVKVILYFGKIRPYKNVPQLIEAFRQVPDPEVVLYVVGHPEFFSQVTVLEGEVAGDSRVQLHFEFVPKEKAQVYFRAAHLVILPYREILNSGSALLALSFNRPLLVPARGTLSELQAQVGKEWVRTYAGELKPSDIAKALDWALNAPRPQQCLLDAFGWQKLAQQTINAYKTIIANKR